MFAAALEKAETPFFSMGKKGIHGAFLKPIFRQDMTITHRNLKQYVRTRARIARIQY